MNRMLGITYVWLSRTLKHFMEINVHLPIVLDEIFKILDDRQESAIWLSNLREGIIEPLL
jgi:hypothetical protein